MLRSINLPLAMIGLSISICTSAFGNSASPFPVQVQQPGGNEVTLFLRGNEKLHWYEYVPEAVQMKATRSLTAEEARVASQPGYVVVQNAQGAYVYAQLGNDGNWIASDIVVGQGPPPAVERRVMPPRDKIDRVIIQRLPEQSIPSRSAAPLGQVKNLVVLLRFADHVGRTLPPPSDFEVLFNSRTKDPRITPTGSVNTFYRENSYGKLDLNSTVVGWVTLPKTEAYYADGQSGLTVRVTEAIRDGLNLVRSQGLVNFADFDNENGGAGDGWIDAVTFVHSGYAAEFGGTAAGVSQKDRIWSHRWSISPWTDPTSGVKVSDYNINPGLWSTSGSDIGRIGVICHELGHFFGLPDLYDYSGVGEGCGSWCLMANSWGFDGSQLHPPHMSAWCKVSLSWNTAKPITSPGVYSVISTAEAGANIYRIDYPSGSPSEYLLIENRQPIGDYDGGIPSGAGGKGGLAVWHIDDAVNENDQPGYPGAPGFPGQHYKVGLIQADNAWDLERGNNRGDAKDLFRAGHVDALSSTSTPSSNSFTALAIDPISKISAPQAVMSFQYGDVTEDGDSSGEGATFTKSVQLDVPTSHASNFSPDGKAVTIICDHLASESTQSDTDVQHATFFLPVKPTDKPAVLRIHVRGYVDRAADSSAGFILSACGQTTATEPQVQQPVTPNSVAYASKEELGKANSLAVARGINPRARNSSDPNFFQDFKIPLKAGARVPITLVLITTKNKSGSAGAKIVIDSIDVEIVDN